jgi:hypothetical protein
MLNNLYRLWKKLVNNDSEYWKDFLPNDLYVASKRMKLLDKLDNRFIKKMLENYKKELGWEITSLIAKGIIINCIFLYDCGLTRNYIGGIVSIVCKSLNSQEFLEKFEGLKNEKEVEEIIKNVFLSTLPNLKDCYI